MGIANVVLKCKYGDYARAYSGRALIPVQNASNSRCDCAGVTLETHGETAKVLEAHGETEKVSPVRSTVCSIAKGTRKVSVSANTAACALHYSATPSALI